MLKLTKSIPLLLLTVFQLSLLGQYEFRPGYIVNHHDDTTYVLIDHETWNISPTTINVKKSLDAPIEVFTLSDLKYFEVGNEVYYNEIVAVNNPSTSYEFNEVPKSKEPVFENRNAFLRKYVSGTIKLYILDDKDGVNHYYIQKHQDSLMPLTFVRYIDTSVFETGNSDYIFYNSLYRYELAKMMNDRPDLIPAIGECNYRLNDFVKILKAYNGETFSTHLINRGPVPAHLIPSYKFYFQPGAIIGIARTSRKNKDIESDQNITVSKYEPKNVSPQIGLTLNMFSEKNPFISLYTEIIFQKLIAVAEYTIVQEAGGIYTNYSEAIDQLNLVPMFAARFQPRINSKSRLYFFFGFNYTISVNNNNTYDEVKWRYGNIDDETHTNGSPLQSIGVTSGIGYALKSFSFDVRASKQTPHAGISFNISYNLNGETPKVNK